MSNYRKEQLTVDRNQIAFGDPGIDKDVILGNMIYFALCADQPILESLCDSRKHERYIQQTLGKVALNLMGQQNILLAPGINYEAGKSYIIEIARNMGYTPTVVKYEEWKK